ncbi:MAG: PEP-CTERM sorting domain-containing protein [Geobacteraceae bacterium]|nr:PEP-CTERM sorting domain-containing protein [Geobacteraceae bacterium]
MKCIRLSALAASLILVLFAVSAWGYPVSVGDTIKIYHGNGTTNGGEWIVKNADGSTYLFTTFCVEIDEYLLLGKPFIVSNISNQAERGGANTDAGDPLSNETKWLFWHYTQGDLDVLVAGYTYGTNSGANALQRAIWLLEEEIATTSDVLAKKLVAAAKDNSTGFAEDVAVINLTYPNGCYAQDLLVAGEPYIPPQEQVPEPSSILLAGMGILGAAWWTRRRKA